MAPKPVCNKCGCYPFPTPRIAWTRYWCINCLNERLDLIEAEFKAERARTKETPPTQEEVDEFLAYLLNPNTPEPEE